MMHGRFPAVLSLLLLIPAPSLGVLAGMVVWPDTALGQGCFMAAKTWLYGLPALWFLVLERQRPSWSPARRGGWGVAVASGLAISAIIAAVWLSIGPLLVDPAFVKARAAEVGIHRPLVYLAFAAYTILVNSVLEEYVWRWFVVRQASRILGQRGAIWVSGLAFTLHHALALSVYFAWPAVLICSLGVLLGGLTWSWMYGRYGSVWPGYLSHALVDVAILAVGATLILR